ncbi:MAG TPA: hypothetical protein VMT11_13635 [Myxococcaceae bacterium]|nr:hypothetical protein [Myxococcaceae bacterium]
MRTIDLRKQHRELYQAGRKEPELVEVPELSFLSTDGRIERGSSPGTSAAFQEAVQALYGAAYTLKFSFKKRKTGAVDWPVMPLEALWWVENGQFDLARPDDWSWRAMILQPEQVTAEALEEAVAQLRRKRPSAALERLWLLRYEEGPCVQCLHLGPYAREPATVERMRAFAEEKGLLERYEVRERRGHRDVYAHHEIYLGDPRRTAPEKLKTLLRHPVRRSKARPG